MPSEAPEVPTQHPAVDAFFSVVDRYYPPQPEMEEDLDLAAGGVVDRQVVRDGVPQFIPLISAKERGVAHAVAAAAAYFVETRLTSDSVETVMRKVEKYLRESFLGLLREGGERRDHQPGYYIRVVNNLPPVVTGQWGFVNVVIVPPDHMPPSHRHTNDGNGVGEITASVLGELGYIGPDGKVQRLRQDENPRISPPDLDVYCTQPEGKWYVGIFVQRVPCAMLSEEDPTVRERRALTAA